MCICNDLCKVLVSAGFPSCLCLLLSARLGCGRRPSACSFYEFVPRGEHKTLGIKIAKSYRANGITPLKKQRLFILFMILLVLTSWSRLCSFLHPKDTKMTVVHSRSDLWVQNAFNEYWIRSGLRTWEHHGCSYAWKAVETHCTELSAAWLDFQKMLKYRHPSAGSTTLLLVHPCPSYRGNNCHIAMCWRHFGFVLRKRRSQCNSTMYNLFFKCAASQHKAVHWSIQYTFVYCMIL